MYCLLEASWFVPLNTSLPYARCRDLLPEDNFVESMSNADLREVSETPNVGLKDTSPPRVHRVSRMSLRKGAHPFPQ